MNCTGGLCTPGRFADGPLWAPPQRAVSYGPSTMKSATETRKVCFVQIDLLLNQGAILQHQADFLSSSYHDIYLSPRDCKLHRKMEHMASILLLSQLFYELSVCLASERITGMRRMWTSTRVGCTAWHMARPWQQPPGTIRRQAAQITVKPACFGRDHLRVTEARNLLPRLTCCAAAASLQRTY